MKYTNCQFNDVLCTGMGAVVRRGNMGGIQKLTWGEIYQELDVV